MNYPERKNLIKKIIADIELLEDSEFPHLLGLPTKLRKIKNFIRDIENIFEENKIL